MLSVSDYIKIILKKKKWTNVRLTNEINKIEEKMGDKRTYPQNVTNYLNGYHEIRPKWLAKVEKALGLPTYTLLNMVAQPSSSEAKKELEDVLNKLKDI